MPIYLQLTGGEQPITGDATQSEHVGWMDISSMHWSVNRNVSTTVGAAANREASEPNLSEVTLTKISDSSHAALYQAATTGKQPMTATIDLVNTGNPGKVYCQYILQNTLVSGFTVRLVRGSADRDVDAELHPEERELHQGRCLGQSDGIAGDVQPGHGAGQPADAGVAGIQPRLDPLAIGCIVGHVR